MTWGDRAIGIGLGLILGIAAVVLFVFSGSEETIDDPQIDVKGLMKHLKGPDFPTGGMIVGHGGIRDAYETGRGSIKVSAVSTIEEAPNGRQRIVITELPYQVNKARLAEKIA